MGAVSVLVTSGDQGSTHLFYSRDPATGHLPRSSSIDSMVEAVWCDSPRASISSECPQTLTPNYGNLLAPRRESFMSPAAGRRTKQHRGINGEYKCFCSVFHQFQSQRVQIANENWNIEKKKITFKLESEKIGKLNKNAMTK
jgi:hypothetical protein